MELWRPAMNSQHETPEAFAKNGPWVTQHPTSPRGAASSSIINKPILIPFTRKHKMTFAKQKLLKCGTNTPLTDNSREMRAAEANGGWLISGSEQSIM